MAGVNSLRRRFCSVCFGNKSDITSFYWCNTQALKTLYIENMRNCSLTITFDRGLLPSRASFVVGSLAISSLYSSTMEFQSRCSLKRQWPHLPEGRMQTAEKKTTQRGKASIFRQHDEQNVQMPHLIAQLIAYIKSLNTGLAIFITGLLITHEALLRSY